jgi:tRNA1Val (adenine37-N6)-methyltransferase
METSTDTISLRGAGIVTITQSKKGHRFTLDSLLLADFCNIKSRDKVLEPGAGTGIISILLAKKFPNARFIADEFEPRAYELLCRNIDKNGVIDTIVPLSSNLKYLTRVIAPNSLDVIIANPPYVKCGTGITSPVTVRQTARHDQSASLSGWLDLQRLLRNRGRYVLVFAAQRCAELLSAMREKNLEPKSIRFVHPSMDKPASLVLLEAVKSGGIGMDVRPPIIVHKHNGHHTDEIKEIYGMEMHESGYVPG